MIFCHNFGYKLFMYKSKLAIALDSILISLLTFIVTFFWTRRFIKSAFFAIFICIFVSLCLFVVIFCYFIKKYKYNKLSLSEQKHLKLCIENLKFSPIQTQIEFFENLFSAKSKGNKIFENSNYIVLINIRNQLCENDFYNAIDYSFSSQKKVIFVCVNFNNEFKNLYFNYSHNFQIFYINDLYQLMKASNKFPINQPQQPCFKQKLKIRLTTFISTISRHRFKDYFLSGLSLVFLSFFIPYSLLYLLIGSILLFLAIICLLTKKNNIISKKQVSLIDTIKK